MLKITEITIEEFKNNIYKEFLKLFPKEEQREWPKIKKAYQKGLEHFYKIAIKDETIGFFMLEKLDNSPYYLDYFAIFEKYQNKGYGTKALQRLLDKVVNKEGLLCEIEKVDRSNTITTQRFKFYKNLGFRKVNSEYILFKVLFVPMIYDKNKKLTKKQVDKVIIDYYIENCGLSSVKKNCKIIK